MFKSRNKKGFTLIELLVVIAIIGFIASVAMVALNNTRVQSRDAQRIADLKTISKAIEMYHQDKGYYPKIVNASDFDTVNPTTPDPCGLFGRWCQLATELKNGNYLQILPKDPSSSTQYRFIYESNSEDNWQTYGLAVTLEHSGNSSLETGDGGPNNSWYELGNQPDFCKKLGYMWLKGNTVSPNGVCSTTVAN